MKNKLRLFFLCILFPLCKYSTGQIVCIFCYDQNDSISSGVNNLLLNGGFETTIGATTGSFCPNSSNYTFDFANWTCTGGGTSTYAHISNSAFSWIPEGALAAYFGNYFCESCSPVPSDTSCLISAECAVTGVPDGYPVNPDIAYGGATGVSLSQTVSGLTIGNTYVLEFWAGGEYYGGYGDRGLFAVDIGFGDTLFRDKPTLPFSGVGTRFIIEFNATSSSHTIKFTNWGHICSTCTELILDDVRLFTLAELSPIVPPCAQLSSSSSFAASDTDICEKFCINFFDSSLNNPTSWQWIFPGGDPAYSTDQNPTNICYDVPGIYDVTLITTNAGGSDTLTLSSYITVYTNPFAPVITQTGNTLTSSPAASYQWQFNSVDIPGATNQSYTIIQSGLYTVIIGDDNGCSAQAIVDASYVGIAGVDGNSFVNVFPNPSSGNFIVEFSCAEASENRSLEIDVVNVIGQKVFSATESRPIASSHFKKEIDLTNFAAGVYYITIQSENIFLMKKVMIAR